ncbi:MAG: NfeD family protein [Thermoplasmata archaeon]
MLTHSTGNRLKIILMAVSLVIMLSMLSVSVQAQQKNVVVINLDEEIDAGSSNMIVTTLNGLNSSTTEAVIISMNTPGGILENMLQMVNAITGAESRGIPVYTYIPVNGMGASAGSYVAMATEGIYMGNGSYIGPSTPIVEGGTALQEQHTTSAMEELMVSMASENGRNVSAAYSMVSNNTAYTANEAYKIGLVEGVYSSLASLISAKDLSGYPVVNVYPSVYDNFLSFLSNPYVDGILIILGFVAIMLDFLHGTVVLSITGATMLVLGFLGAQLISASIVGIILLMMGAVLILLEAKTGHGFSLLSGVVIGLVGTFMLASPYYSSNPGYSPSPFTTFDLLTTILILIVVGFLVFYIRRILKTLKYHRMKNSGAEALISRQAVAVTDIDPHGWVSVDGIEWQAETEDKSSIMKGEKVIIVSRDELVLIVRKVDKNQGQKL